MRAPPRPPRWLLCLAALAFAGDAWADGWSLQAEPALSASGTESRPAGGEATRTESTTFSQRYRLSLDRRFWPYLGLSGSGQWEQLRNWADAGDVSTENDNRRWSAFGTLFFGPPVLSGMVTYSRRETEASQRISGLPPTESPTLVFETVSGALGWRPAGGPSLDLRVGRTDTHDAQRELEDRNGTSAILSARYTEIRNFDLRGAVNYSTTTDELRGTESQDWSENLSVLWSDGFLDRRVRASASYSIGRRDSEVTASSPDALFLTQQLPVEGLSRSCAARPCELPTTGALLSNPALVDGQLETSAGIDLGYGVQPSDLTRELGVRLADLATPVNRVFVYVDRPVPLGLVTAFSWTVYQSEDGVTWTQVGLPISGGVTFGLFQNRFEIPIPLVQNRYLKVLTAPLTVTTDTSLQQLNVTEVQLFHAQRAADVVGRASDTSGSLTASVRALLQRSYNVAYDFGFFISHGRRSTWSMVNGISAGRALGSKSAWHARADRADSGGDDGWASSSRLSAQLSWDPLPTLGGNLGASSGVSQSARGTSWTASSSLLARADLYPGVSLGANGSAGLGRNEEGIDTRSASTSISATVVPHRTTSLTGAYAVSVAQFGSQPWDRRSRIEANVAWAPFPALSLAGGIARSEERGRPATLASFSVAASPFRGGDLSLSFGYNDTLDTAQDQRTRSWGPGLRWNVRAGTYLSVVYTDSEIRSEALDTDSQSVFANLVITLR